MTTPPSDPRPHQADADEETWTALVGPFYSEPDTAEWLDVSVAELRARADRLELLGLPLAESNTYVYPAWQFTAARAVIPHLASVLHALAYGTPDRWTWALWITAPDDDWEGRTAWRWLAAGGSPKPVLAEAHSDASRWRQ